MSKQAFDYPADKPIVQITVTDEMVEAAIREFWNVAHSRRIAIDPAIRKKMREVLEAALIRCTALPAFPRGLVQAAALTLPGGVQEAGILPDGESREAYEWIDQAYRKPEDPALDAAPRFTRYNMAVAYHAGQQSRPVQSVEEYLEGDCSPVSATNTEKVHIALEAAKRIMEGHYGDDAVLVASVLLEKFGE